MLIPCETQEIPSDFVKELDPELVSVAQQVYSDLFQSSNRRILARLWQLQVMIALRKGQDVILSAGTGSGKMLTFILPLIVDLCTVSITISPLKQLHNTHALDLSKLGIQMAAINQDTPTDPQFWQKVENRYFQHFVVLPDQLFAFKGHIPRFATLLEKPAFRNKVKFLNIDEAHHHYTWGLKQAGQDPFSTAWGKLDSI
ncbi:hypothetical protein K439DRAFT_1344519 [Ramaria rubella]|nr:hypothetical protein K439DRAFT_1344519 [Ramaria rubella]